MLNTKTFQAAIAHLRQYREELTQREPVDYVDGVWLRDIEQELDDVNEILGIHDDGDPHLVIN